MKTAREKYMNDALQVLDEYVSRVPKRSPSGPRSIVGSRGF